MAADYQLWIDGRSVGAASGETFETFDPSTGQAHATVARAGQADVARAVAAAGAAYAIFFHQGPVLAVIPFDDDDQAGDVTIPGRRPPAP